MNLPVMCQSMFSVEQVEFVRRLRSSGLTRDQVLAIWDRLDRIDAEFTQQQLTTATGGHSRDFLQLLQQERQQQASALMMMQMQQLLSSAAGTGSTTNSTNKVFSQQTPANKQTSSSSSTAAAVAAAEKAQQNAQSIENNECSDSSPAALVSDLSTAGKSEPQIVDSPSISCNNNVNNSSSQQPEVPARLVDETDAELVEFLRKNNEPQICEQIRQFIALNGIKQHQVAVLVGTSQSYISKYLKADYLEMSERSRRNIYRWYVTYRSQPTRAITDACAVITNPHLLHNSNSMTNSSALPLTTSLATNNTGVGVGVGLPLYSVLGNNNNAENNNGNVSPGVGNNLPGSPRSTSSSSVYNGVTPSSGGAGGGHQGGSSVSPWNLLSTSLGGLGSSSSVAGGSHRRFRFTFRAQQLAILEKAFAEDTYPTVERREELARQLSVGLEGEQAVSLFTVTNWFANRRKEAKRAAVEEGLNVEELGMKRGRGRPSILHRMASAQLRETRANQIMPGDGSINSISTAAAAVAARLANNNSSSSTTANNNNNNNHNNNNHVDSCHNGAKRARKTTGDDDAERGDEDCDDQCSMMSSTAGCDAPDDLSSSSGGHHYQNRQPNTELAVFPTPELIAG